MEKGNQQPKPRDRQMAVMTTTPTRDRFFIFALSCRQCLLRPAVEARLSAKSEPGAGLLDLWYAAHWQFNAARQL
jgi:hypothetical protein